MWWFFKKKVNHRWKHLHKTLENSFLNIKKDFEHVHDLIKKIESKKDEHHSNIEKILERLERLERSVYAENRHYNAYKPQFERVQSFNRSVQSFMNIQDIKRLTPAQQQVIALLMGAGGPMDYEDIAKQLGLNVVTARRHINDITRVGFRINKKVSVKTRRKMFYLDEKVKNMLIEKGIKTRERD